MSAANSYEAPKAWGDDVALRGPDAPKNDGSLKHLIEYLLTVYERFGNTTVTENISLQWGSNALHKRDAQKERIAELEAQIASSHRPESGGSWIFIRERRPEGRDEVLVVTNYGMVTTRSAAWVRDLYAESVQNNELCALSYWMPMPTAPGLDATPNPEEG